MIAIARLAQLVAGGAEAAPLVAGIDRIFRATSAHWPNDPAAAAAFRDLWLGQYLRHEPDLVFLALDGEQAGAARVAGYLVGCRVDPATSPRFATLDYFHAFAPLTRRYPAHLHVNLDAAHRGHGTGALLVDAFVAQMAAENVGGVHVVTGAAMRNVGFYRRLGFAELTRAPRGGGEVMLLGRVCGRR